MVSCFLDFETKAVSLSSCCNKCRKTWLVTKSADKADTVIQTCERLGHRARLLDSCQHCTSVSETFLNSLPNCDHEKGCFFETELDEAQGNKKPFKLCLECEEEAVATLPQCSHSKELNTAVLEPISFAITVIQNRVSQPKSIIFYPFPSDTWECWRQRENLQGLL